MPQTTVEIRTLADSCLAMGSSGPRTVMIDRPKEPGGLALGFNGGELLLLAIGGCCGNDPYRESAKRDLRVHNVDVTVDADGGGDPVRAQNVAFSVTVDLICQTGFATGVTLNGAKVVSSGPSQ